jgi:hypothetical protein
LVLSLSLLSFMACISYCPDHFSEFPPPDTPRQSGLIQVKHACLNGGCMFVLHFLLPQFTSIASSLQWHARTTGSLENDPWYFCHQVSFNLRVPALVNSSTSIGLLVLLAPFSGMLDP